MPLTVIAKPDAVRCTRNWLAILRGKLDRDTFLAMINPDSVIRVPRLPWPPAPGGLVTARMIPPSARYSVLRSSSASISKSVTSPVAALAVSTRILLAMPNPANFPIPFRPMARRPERVCAPFLPARRSYPTFMYSAWHSSKVIRARCPLRRSSSPRQGYRVAECRPWSRRRPTHWRQARPASRRGFDTPESRAGRVFFHGMSGGDPWQTPSG